MSDSVLVRPERFFSDRFNVTPSLMERVLGTALKGRVDDADIYLEYRINEELVLEEGAVKKASRHVSQGAGVPHDLYTLDEPPIVTDLARKLELLRKVDAAARAADPRIRQVIASVASEEVITLIATVTGWTVGDVRPLTRLNVTTIAEDNGKREIGTYGGGGRVRFDYFLAEDRWKRFATEAARQATL